LIGVVIIAAWAIAAYSRTFSVPLLFDDITAIANNRSIRHWATAFWPPVDTTASGRPVLNLSLAINYAISGTAVWSYHVANLAIHILAALTLFGIVRRTLSTRAGPRAASIAFCAALIWVLHPLQTESVTYVVQRAESLMGLFYLLTVYCFIRGSETESRVRNLWFTLCVGACLLGMATKEVMVSAPLIVLLYDRTFVSGSFREAWRRRWMVFSGLGATWLILVFLVHSTHGRSGTAGFESGVSPWRYWVNQFPVVMHYLKLSIWPRPLVFDYGTEWTGNLWVILPSAVIVIGVIAATGWALVRPNLSWKSVGFAGAWFFAVLAPTSLVPINRQTAAEHRMYLALIPVVVLAIVGIHRKLGRGALPLCLALAAGLFGMTFQRNEDYRSALVLWTDTVAKRPENAFAHDYLGSELEIVPGRTEDAIKQFEEALLLKPDYAVSHNNLGTVLQKLPGRLYDAIAQYEEALRIKSDFAETHNNLGTALETVPGRLNEAIAQYKEALRLKPDYPKAHNNLGAALEKVPGQTDEAIAQFEEALREEPGFAETHNDLGIALGSEDKIPQAITQYEEALRINPDLAEAHSNLGEVLSRMPGRLNEGIAQLEEALRLNPGLVEAHVNLGAALERMPGRLEDAFAQFEEALRLKPDYAEVHNEFGAALEKGSGRLNDAIGQFEEAVRLKPDYADAHNNLGGALAQEPGRLGDAISQYKEALRLKPGSAEAHYNLGNALSAEGETPQAIAEYGEALRIKPNFVEAHSNLGAALEKMSGRLNEAIDQYEQALRLNPDYAAIHLNLALALIRLTGHNQEARANLEAVLRLQPDNDRARQILATIPATQ
jgi:tetratricopeptide (TPR) repeat protein